MIKVFVMCYPPPQLLTVRKFASRTSSATSSSFHALPASSSYSARSHAAGACAGSRGCQRVRVAQAERAVDQQRGAGAVALRDEQQPRLLAERDARAAEEGRKVDHAVEVAAHVRHAPEPGPRLRHRR